MVLLSSRGPCAAIGSRCQNMNPSSPYPIIWRQPKTVLLARNGQWIFIGDLRIDYLSVKPLLIITFYSIKWAMHVAAFHLNSTGCIASSSAKGSAPDDRVCEWSTVCAQANKEARWPILKRTEVIFPTLQTGFAQSPGGGQSVTLGRQCILDIQPPRSSKGVRANPPGHNHNQR